MRGRWFPVLRTLFCTSSTKSFFLVVCTFQVLPLLNGPASRSTNFSLLRKKSIVGEDWLIDWHRLKSPNNMSCENEYKNYVYRNLGRIKPHSHIASRRRHKLISNWMPHHALSVFIILIDTCSYDLVKSGLLAKRSNFSYIHALSTEQCSTCIAGFSLSLFAPFSFIYVYIRAAYFNKTDLFQWNDY